MLNKKKASMGDKCPHNSAFNVAVVVIILIIINNINYC